MPDSHSFDVAVAQKLKSVEQAIMLDYFSYWQVRNMANEHNFRKGKYWTYNKLSDFIKLFPYWSVKQVRTILDHIEKGKYIETDNPGGQDRTTWYTLTPKGIELMVYVLDNHSIAQTGKCICPNRHMDLPVWADAFAHLGISICPNGQMIYKDTITEHTVQEPLLNAEALNAPAGESEPVVQTLPAEESPSSPPVAAAPPSPKKQYGDGELQKQVRQFFKAHPDQYPEAMYPKFLSHYTAIVQNSQFEKDIGKELWRTTKTFPLESKLDNWHQNDVNRESATRTGQSYNAGTGSTPRPTTAKTANSRPVKRTATVKPGMFNRNGQSSRDADRDGERTTIRIDVGGDH